MEFFRIGLLISEDLLMDGLFVTLHVLPIEYDTKNCMSSLKQKWELNILLSATLRLNVINSLS